MRKAKVLGYVLVLIVLIAIIWLVYARTHVVNSSPVAENVSIEVPAVAEQAPVVEPIAEVNPVAAPKEEAVKASLDAVELAAEATNVAPTENITK